MAAGDITYSHPAAQDSASAFASGTLSCNTAAAANILCGFQPTRIVLFYKDDGATTNDEVKEWFKGLPSGYYFDTKMSTGAISYRTSGAPTVYAGSAYDGYSEGFTIPAALQITDEDIIYWQAWR